MKKVICKGMLLVAVLCMVLVNAVPTVSAAKVKLSKSSLTVCVGETKQLKLSGFSGTVTWSSSDKKVATVSKKGVVTAKGEGKCKITAKVKGKSYTCKVTVQALPEDYATVNGVKVKVGSKVKIAFSIKSSKKIAYISILYRYNKKALKITNWDNDDSRFGDWVCDTSMQDYNMDGKTGDLCQLVGYNPKTPYDISEIACKNGKVYDKLEIKVLKSGNYTFKNGVYHVSGIYTHSIKYTITEKTTVK